MRTWKQNISKSKFMRVKNDPASQSAVKRGSQVALGWFGPKNSDYGYVLGDFIYTTEYNSNGCEYFKYRIKPVAAYAVDYGYYEERLQCEEKV